MLQTVVVQNINNLLKYKDTDLMRNNENGKVLRYSDWVCLWKIDPGRTTV